MGTKSFTNNTGVALKVCIFVRAGSNPGCIKSRIGFNLIANETKVITYGNDENPFLDGIVAIADSSDQFVCTKMCVKTRGSSVDNLLNTHSKIFFELEVGSIVVDASN